VSYDDNFRDSPAFRDSIAYRESVTAARNVTGLRGQYDDDDQTTARTPMYSPGSYPIGGHQAAGDPADEYRPEEYGTDKTLGISDDPASSPPPVTYRAPRLARPPRDRLGVHVGWEIVLLLGAVAVAVLLWRAAPGALRGAARDALFIQAAIVGAVAVGMALSLRAAVPNLALGPIVFAGAMFFAENADRGLLVTAGMTGLLAAAAGVAMAIVVTAFHVPSWAASLAAGLGLIAWIQGHRRGVELVSGAYDPGDHAVLFFAGFVALSVLGGLLGLAGALRRGTGRYRPESDPAARRRGAVAAAMALIGSSVFAAAAGVLLALNNRQIATTENGVGLTALALGAALLGGTSIYGRHGGLFGTALAVVGLVLLSNYAAVENRGVSVFALAGAAIGVGLLVSRLVEALGRPRPVPEPPPPVQVTYEPAEPSDDTWAPGGANPWDAPAADPPPEHRWDERWASH
jgi:ribose/xylose/arabinose/galactoside ABC-type transport system permease subunit